ncbi:hypothetical protein AUR64_03910 [Haloprofundus marisrubri]|uniref:Helicase C-terminal domain-containing protein n=1 Tax=Haloprofundus marisrubri TaxID=1514971 RepID=A0A0W1RDC5_9EURY|nr:helicase-related protein [Haloprofundus marisrubri]KTG11409.1 hypothetical protein AUR64_03910 [Haloprofundus marisrubri]
MDNREGTWRYPPHIETTVLVAADQLEDATLNIRGGFHRAGFLKYRETRPNYTGPITNSPDIDVPSAFADVDFCSERVSLPVNSDGDVKFEDRSIPLQSYEFDTSVPLAAAMDEAVTVSSTLSRVQETIKLYDEDDDTTKIADVNDRGEVERAVDETPYTGDSNARAAYITLERGQIKFKLEVSIESSTTYDGYARVRIQLLNQGSGTLPRQSYRLHEKAESLFNPFLHFSVDDIEVKFPAQQHADVLKNAINNGDETSRQDREEIEAIYTQTNGTLTRLTQDPSTFVITTYGVFDYLREVPKEAYRIDELTESTDSLRAHLNALNESERAAVSNSDGLLELTHEVLSALPDAFGLEATDTLYAFQWEAIQRRMVILANGEQVTTLLKAPTGAGKTIPFMVNAALTALWKDTRAVLAFPTRLLNEDMSKRVTRFVYALRATLDRSDIDAGVLIGSSDPMYNSLTKPELGEPLAQYDQCPACDTKGSVIAAKPNHRVVGQCTNCSHVIDYVYGPREAISYLPTITVATPDKLWYEATVRGYESQPYGKLPFFGGRFLSCGRCGAAASVMSPYPDQKNVKCPECKHKIPLEEDNYEYSPIGHWVFDEAHGLHGFTGTLLSIFLELPNLLYSKIRGHNYTGGDYLVKPTFETGTATIANEIELLSAVTRTDRSRIEAIPATAEYGDYFKIDTDATRYRVLAILPVGTSNRQSVQRALIATHHAVHEDQAFRDELQAALDAAGRGATVSAYEFLLGYVYKKADGRALRNSISDTSGQRLTSEITPPFLSGNTDSKTMGELFERAQNGELPMLLANLVISLGIDIENLNNMVMLGAPRKMTEQVQTAGRTGRGDTPGHVTMHLLPSNPRDVYLYGNFHRVLGDVEGYYETYPIQPTNAHAAELLMPNLLKAVLAGMSYDDFVLTARRASAALSDTATENQIRYDLLRLLRTDDTPKDLVAEINQTVQNRLRDYEHKWGRIDNTVYLSQWFQDQGNMMYTLRKGSDRHIDIDVEQDTLLSRLDRDYTVTTTN